MPGLLKIGYTTREDVQERVSELSSATGVPSRFQVEYFCLTKRVEEVEGAIHKEYASSRIDGKEFFRADAGEVVETIDKLVEQNMVHPQNLWVTSGSGRSPSV
ncbi:MAG: GIY-YIG nuclease family protein [Deferrisomatales bacterium]